MNLVDSISKEISTTNQFPEFGAGDSITVYYKIKEGSKERIQHFKGVVLQRKGSVTVDAKNFIKISFDETTNPPKIIQKVLGKQKIDKDLIYVVIFCRKELEAAKFYICTQGDIQKIVDKNYRADLEKRGWVRPKKPKSTHCSYGERDLSKFKDNWDLILKT